MISTVNTEAADFWPLQKCSEVKAGFRKEHIKNTPPNPTKLIGGQGLIRCCPDLTFTPLFYLLQGGTSGSGPGKQTLSSNCTCPRRKRRNALLTKGRIFRAAFPPIKAACLIPSKLKIKERLFRSCQPIKLQAERRTSLFLHSQVDSPFQFPARRGALSRWKGHLDTGPSQESRIHSSKILTDQHHDLAKYPVIPLSPWLHLEHRLPPFILFPNPKGVTIHFCAQWKFPAPSLPP